MTELEELKQKMCETGAESDVAWDDYIMAWGYWEDLLEVKSETDPAVKEAWLEHKGLEELWSKLHMIWLDAKSAYEDELNSQRAEALNQLDSAKFNVAVLELRVAKLMGEL